MTAADGARRCLRCERELEYEGQLAYCESCRSHLSTAVNAVVPRQAAPGPEVGAVPTATQRERAITFPWLGLLLLSLSVVDIAYAVSTKTTAALGGFGPLLALIIGVTNFLRWWRTLQHPILSRETKRLLIRVWLVTGITMTIGGGSLTNNHGDGSVNSGTWLMMAGIALICFPAALWWANKFGNVMSDAIREANTPVPSPAEIAYRLEAEWGRPATVTEIAAVHQMLTSRRNQALIDTGISLGALYLVDRNLHHR